MTSLRQSIRGFIQSPGLTLALLLTIGLGIGSNASLFGFVRGLAPRPMPIADIDRVVSVFSHAQGDIYRPLSYDRFESLKGRLESFEWIGAARESQSAVVLQRANAVMAVAAITPEIADLLGFTSRGGVVISHRSWVMDFGGKPDVRGQPLRVDDVDTQVGDIAPEWLDGLYFGRSVDIWMPLSPTQTVERTSRTFLVFGKLRPGASVKTAQDQVRSALVSAGEVMVLPYSGMTPEMAAGISRVTLVLLVAAGLVFLIACSNVASFLVSRAAAQWHETATRVALGAGRRDIVRQLFTDSALISLAGAGLGILVATWTIDVVGSLLFDKDAEQLMFSPSFAGIIATSAACVVITIVCGLTPLFEIRHDDPAAVLQREGVGPSTAMRRLRSSLVVGQSAVCCLLVISTGLLLDSFRSALQTYAGQRLGRPILATLQARERFERQELGVDYLNRAEQAARSVPGISGTVWVGTIPGTRGASRSMHIEPPPQTFRDVSMDVALFTPDSLELITLPPLAGRMFGGADSARCGVVVVNEAAAGELFDGDAVGRSIEDAEGQPVEIVGVVAMRHPSGAPHNRPLIFYSELTGTPFDREGPMRFRVPMPRTSAGVLDVNVVSANYFEAMDLTLTAGARFEDDGARLGCRVGVVNQEAADSFFAGNAVGAGVIDSSGRRTQIVGVVRTPPLKALQRLPEPTVYLPTSQNFLPRMTLILRTDDPSRALLTSVGRRLDAVPGGGDAVQVQTLDEHLSRTAFAPERLAAVLVGAEAAIALALAALGLHGAMAEFVRQRQREIAMRLALGSTAWRLIVLVLVNGLQRAVAGIVTGMIGAVLVSRWFGALAPVAGGAVWPWVAAPLVAIGAVVIASGPAARRALTVDPASLLKGR